MCRAHLLTADDEVLTVCNLADNKLVKRSKKLQKPIPTFNKPVDSDIHILYLLLLQHTKICDVSS